MLNGAELDADELTLNHVYLVASAEGSLSEAGFADWLRRHLRTQPRDAIHEPRKTYAR